MIVDCATRVFNTPEQLGRDTAQALRRATALRGGRLESTAAAHERASAPVAASLVHGFASRLLDAGIPNEFIAEVVRSNPARLAGIAGIDPMAPDASAALDRALELGLVGVSVSPSAPITQQSNGRRRLGHAPIRLSASRFDGCGNRTIGSMARNGCG